MVVIAIVLLVVVVINRDPQKSNGDRVTTGPQVQATVPSSPPSVPATDSPPSVVPMPTATVPVTPSAVISQAELTSVVIPEIGYEASADTMTTDANGDIDPPKLQPVYRITDRGSAPGTDADNTVYLACHSWSKGDAPCNILSSRAAPGQHILATTSQGTLLDYVIQATRTYSKDGEFRNSVEVRAIVPGRLVWVTCLLGPNGETTNDNFVVIAQLVTG